MKYSLHIGINKYSPIIYGYGNDLNACVQDAEDMWSYAERAGVPIQNTIHLLDENATVENFKKFVTSFGEKAVSGDTFILSYSSHGTQVYDANGDEPDTLDEAICMHNGIVYDDEVSEILSKFKKGVLIIIYADTCHSESQFRLMNQNVNFIRKSKFTSVLKGYHKNNKSASFRNKIVCKVIEFAACRSNSTALDGQVNGYFTEHVMKVIRSKQKSIIATGLKLPRYKSFIKDLTKSMGDTQIPTLTTHNIPRWNNPRIF